MTDRPSYKRTLFDREGPDAGIMFKAYTFAGIAGLLSVPVFMLIGDFIGLGGTASLLLAAIGPVAITVLSAKIALRGMEHVQDGVNKVLTGGASTPYTEQNSYQQALVMQGRLDEALESLEALIAEPESRVDTRIRAAELYTREAKRHDRAADLFREAIRHPNCTPGEEVYAANRLADLLSGPLGQPGRALVELRRLADRYPTSVVGERAREAIRVLKAHIAITTPAD